MTLSNLEFIAVYPCREAGDDPSVREWSGRARDLASDAPAPTADRFRDWLDRRLADPE